MSVFKRSNRAGRGWEPRPTRDSVTTPFEDWCEMAGVHPEAPGAWEAYDAYTVETDSGARVPRPRRGAA